MKKAVLLLLLWCVLGISVYAQKKFCFEISWGKFIYNNCGW